MANKEKDILDALTDFQRNVEARFDNMEARFDNVELEFGNMGERLDKVEIKLSKIDKDMGRILKCVSHENADFDPAARPAKRVVVSR